MALMSDNSCRFVAWKYCPSVHNEKPIQVRTQLLERNAFRASLLLVIHQE